MLQAELAISLRLEELLADLALRFMSRHSAEDIGEEIERAQRRLCDLLGLDRSTLWHVEDRGGAMRLLRVAQPDRIPGLPEGTDAADYFPYTVARVRKGETVLISSLSDLPPEAERDREALRSFGTKSSAVFPLHIGERVFAAMTFATVGAERAWSPSDVRRLELVTQVFASALFRRDADAALRAVSGRLINAQERERARLAQELHDGLSQQLAVLAVEIQLLSLRPPGSDAERQARLEELSAKTQQLSSEVHRLSHALHPAKLERLGLVAALAGFCRELDAAEPLQVRFVAESVPGSLREDWALSLYRVTQEALWNVVKHADARSATVLLKGDGTGVRLEIIDDGRGFDLAAVSGTASLGMLGMRERVWMHGGQISWEAPPGGGTMVRVHLPVTARSRS
ncbi:MAG TPA: GAF domain-containing sensor histidine kinase [Gemmatimonadales bacterium]|nr:GAF domain-containing sensor histidine kinase [Gemmatimonadales bacterium]